MFKKIKLKILKYITRNLFKGLSEEDVINIIRGDLYLGNELINKDVALKYRDEAIKLTENELLKKIDDKIIYETNKLMFDKSQTADDLFFGKAMLHTIAVRQKYLSKIANLRN